MIGIIDYGMGNLGSLVNILKKIEANAVISGNPQELEKCEKLILPGVGAFGQAMGHLKEKGLDSFTRDQVIGLKKPVLGICLGMQLLTKFSEEGHVEGLGFIDAETRKFPFGEANGKTGLKVPHMGWNRVSYNKPHPLLKGLDKVTEYEERPKFYFVHSYFVHVANEENSLMKTTYGFDFDSAIVKGNILGVQFHPEKSHKYGMQLLRNFAFEIHGK